MWKVIGMSMLLLAGQAYGSEAVGCKARQQAVRISWCLPRRTAMRIRSPGWSGPCAISRLTVLTPACSGAAAAGGRAQGAGQRTVGRAAKRQGDGQARQDRQKQAKLEEAQTKLLAAQRELDALSKLIKP